MIILENKCFFRFGSFRESKTSTAESKIFVGGVSPETTVDEVRSYFSRFGKVDAAVLVPSHDRNRRIIGGTDRRDSGHRGFGFVTFASDVVAEKVMDATYLC